MIGQTIAHYKVTAKLGAGGMGEVYRATDSKLGREVALKVLPAAFAADEQRMQRFQREAQVLASLNHPNIAAIYGLEHHEKIQALAMELVEGPTLAERIAQGVVPIEDALPIAKQIAEALEYAHEKGIIHRDLKPANIKLTADGKVKILDFGLAKALQQEDSVSSAGTDFSPTLSLAATKAGIILGTVAYMPPEQAKGKQVDRRADIWSFGCVLYEMLTGHRAYPGEDVSETLAAVIRGEPDWNALPVAPSHPITKLLRRCLEKDIKRRLQAIGEARLMIEDYLANPAAATQAVAADAAPAGVQPAGAARAAWAIAAVATVAAVLLAAAYLGKPAEEPQVVRAFIPAPGKTNFDFVGHPATGPVAISPDGRMLAFAADSEDGSQLLWVREIDSLTARPLPGSDDGAFPFWSPDSRTVGFFAEGKLKKINVAGGPPVTLCNAVSGRGGTWNRDGVIVFSPDAASPLHRVSEAGGNSAPVTQFDPARGESSHRWPHFLPDGRHFLYLARGGPGLTGLTLGEGANIVLGSMDGSAPRVLMPGRYGASYASGHLLMVREDTLMAQPFDAGSLTFTGDPVPVAPQVQLDLSFSRSVFSVSENGVLVYQAGETAAGSQLLWFDRAGKQLGALGDQAVYLDLVISPDGSKVATSITDPGIGPPDVWIYEVSRGLRTRFTFATEVERHPVWAPDSTRVVFSSAPGPFRIYEKSLTGIAREGILLESKTPVFPQSWSSDGRFLAYEARGVPNTAGDVWVMPLAGERQPVAFLQTAFVESAPHFSPDGRWIAYVSQESGRSEVYVAPFPGPGRKLQISTAGGQHPRWRRDGREMYYLAPDNKITAVEVGAIGDTFEIGASKALFETRPNRNGNVYDVSGDGRRFLVNTLSQAQTSEPLTLVVNWPAAIEKKK